MPNNGIARKELSRKLRDKLEALPSKPGVYIFRNRNDRVIYVGKAKVLRNRVRSYFSGGDDGRYQYPRLVASIADVEVLVTRNEVEALRTEATLIRLHRPRFNVDLRDERSYPYLQITREPFPRINLTRKPHQKNADYYGPFTDVKAARSLLRTLKRIFLIRDCRLPLTVPKIEERRFKLCLDYHIGRCRGPCENLVSEAEYRIGIDRFLSFLHGNHDEIMADLESEMKALAGELKFEQAAEWRDKLQAVKRFSDRQQKVSPLPVNQDAIGLVREDDYASFSVLKVRGGRIVGQSPFYMERASGLTDGELLEAFATRHYDLVDAIPEEIFLPLETPDMSILEEYIRLLAEHKVKLHIPQRGEKHSLLNLAEINAEQIMSERRLMAEKRDFTPRSIKALQEHLALPDPPLHIEAFDISNLQGTDSVASMVLFRDGKPYKSGYRIFKIKTVAGINDVASIGEAVKRRYSRLKQEMVDNAGQNQEDEPDKPGAKREQLTLPDLILIDGGKGQLARAKIMLDELGLENIPIIGLAKRLEEIFRPGDPEPLLLPSSSTALRLLQQLRDEAHRFAITKHRMLRHKRQVKSRLDDIPGIGPNRRQELLKAFGSVKRLAVAEVEEIAAVKGMSRKVAELVKKELGR